VQIVKGATDPKQKVLIHRFSTYSVSGIDVYLNCCCIYSYSIQAVNEISTHTLRHISDCGHDEDKIGL
jgi:hypothetical protein